MRYRGLIVSWCLFCLKQLFLIVKYGYHENGACEENLGNLFGCALEAQNPMADDLTPGMYTTSSCVALCVCTKNVLCAVHTVQREFILRLPAGDKKRKTETFIQTTDFVNKRPKGTLPSASFSYHVLPSLHSSRESRVYFISMPQFV